ncbi:uncharacterized protein RHO25_002826 [Cercospora beticola]|uniref:Inhibitor of growth protein N-terminal histone-binding domain-containing protein n=1 Tax=Cercospora beticola TaxID=122368 RepID=A0ABZ0NFD3_CERBT|nr:hypothetical protein RHO25_002826 [Cercospora beticola]CAK1359437.1 unnamed protein product [Cercospora beticola]
MAVAPALEVSFLQTRASVSTHNNRSTIQPPTVIPNLIIQSAYSGALADPRLTMSNTFDVPEDWDAADLKSFNVLRQLIMLEEPDAQVRSQLQSMKPQQLGIVSRQVFDALQQMDVQKHALWIEGGRRDWTPPERTFDLAGAADDVVIESIISMYDSMKEAREDLDVMRSTLAQLEAARTGVSGYYNMQHPGNMVGTSHICNSTCGRPPPQSNGNLRGSSTQDDSSRGGASDRITRNWRGSSGQDDSSRRGASQRINENWRQNWRDSSDQDDGNRSGPPNEVNGGQPGSPDQGVRDRRGSSGSPGGVAVDATTSASGSATSEPADEHNREPPRKPGPT